VLRTEKAINDIACHPLPSSFYEGGGLQYLRQRFEGTDNPDADYFNYPTSATNSPASIPVELKHVTKVKIPETPRPSGIETARSTTSPFRSQSRHMVQAGDLHSSTDGASDAYRPLTRSFSVLNTPYISRSGADNGSRRAASLSGDDFDLREEVMSCIAKSIGLLQPPFSGVDSAEASPRFPPSDGRQSSLSGGFPSSFSSLSLLDLGDDASSTAGGSTVPSPGGYMSGLDNEVEMLFFAAGSTLARAGEVNTGKLHLAAH
jgi:lysophospholipid hydrolase